MPLSLHEAFGKSPASELMQIVDGRKTVDGIRRLMLRSIGKCAPAPLHHVAQSM
jgi:hypothetical protein